jgi:hypothetical protein
MTPQEQKYGKQFTKEQAVAFYKSEVWKGWSHEQIVRMQLFNDFLAVPFDVFHEAIEDVLGRSVWTHEFAYRDELIKEYLKEKEPPTFEEIINLIPKDKRIIVGH